MHFHIGVGDFQPKKTTFTTLWTKIKYTAIYIYNRRAIYTSKTILTTL